MPLIISFRHCAFLSGSNGFLLGGLDRRGEVFSFQIPNVMKDESRCQRTYFFSKCNSNRTVVEATYKLTISNTSGSSVPVEIDVFKLSGSGAKGLLDVVR